MSNINLIDIATVTRSSSVVPAHVFAMGAVCPMTDLVTVSTKRRAAVAQATAWATTPGYRPPWSPPVT